MKKELISYPRYQFEYFPVDSGAPKEFLITSMKSLNVIFYFPIITAFLVKLRKINSTANIEVSVNV